MGSVVVLANCLGMACILAARIGAPSRCATSTVIASSAIIDKAMSAPAVAVAPSSPRPHAQEYAVIEVSRSVEANRGAGVRRIVVVSVRTYRLNADANHHLGICRWRQRAHASEREQSARQYDLIGAKPLESAHV
jgi:hypothetical protein